MIDQAIAKAPAIESSLPDPPVGVGGQARSGNPWFDKLIMTIVTLSLSKGGFSVRTPVNRPGKPRARGQAPVNRPDRSGQAGQAGE